MQQQCINTKQLLLNIKNNTDSEIPIDVLQNAYLNGFFNSSTKYQWNITSQDYSNVDSVSIQVKVADTAYQTYTAILSSKNPDGVIDALNTLNIGSFYKDQQSGQIYIVTNNSNYVYGDLDIFNAHPVTTFWNIYPTYTGFGQEAIGPDIAVYETDYNIAASVPPDVQKYTTAYLWMVKRDAAGQPIVFGSDTTPASSAPNWPAFPGNASNAILAYLTSVFTAATGAAPADYTDVFNGDNLTYSIAAIPVGTWPPASKAGKPSVEAAGSYNWGLLNLPTPQGTLYEVRMKFSKTE